MLPCLLSVVRYSNVPLCNLLTDKVTNESVPWYCTLLPVLARGCPWTQGTAPCSRSLSEAIPGRKVLYTVASPCPRLSLDAGYCTLLPVLARGCPWTQGTVPFCRSLPEAIPGRRVLYTVAGPCPRLSLDAGYCTLLPVVA